MYKVVLVDDEPWTLIGIEESIPWESMGFEVIYKTSSPAEALKVILDRQPEVVLTDIRMPGMTGIELINKARENGLKTEFIIISGYAEFSYAQDAIRLGAFDYCLKPINEEQAGKVLLRLNRHLADRIRNNAGPDPLYSDIPKENPQFEKLIRYINEHYQEKLYLRDLAAMFSINSNYCCYLFKTILKRSFSDYILDIRMQEAKKWVLDPKLSIEEASLKSGFSDYFYFNKVFKKYYEVTPSKYRKNSLSV